MTSRSHFQHKLSCDSIIKIGIFAQFYVYFTNVILSIEFELNYLCLHAQPLRLQEFWPYIKVFHNLHLVYQLCSWKNKTNKKNPCSFVCNAFPKPEFVWVFKNFSNNFFLVLTQPSTGKLFHFSTNFNKRKSKLKTSAIVV